MKTGIGLMAALAVVLLMVGCSSDGGGGATDVQASSLEGTWFGTLTDSVGNLSEHSLTLDGSGNVTGQTVGGTGTGLTATITKETNQVFSFLFSDGSVGGLIVDGVAHQAAFLDDSFHFGVL